MENCKVIAITNQKGIYGEEPACGSQGKRTRTYEIRRSNG